MHKVKILLLTFLFMILFSFTTHAQDTTVVETTAGNEFAPAGVIIEQGNYVKWVNTSQGIHNVVADDGSFDSGDPSSDRWEYVVQFNDVGFFNYYCEVHGGTGGSGMAGFVQVEEPTSVDDESKKYNYSLDQNYPNPFNPTTSISYAVPQTSEVQIRIFDVLGNEISVLVNDVKSAGEYSVNWTAESLTSGVYIYKLSANAVNENTNFAQTKKMLLMK